MLPKRALSALVFVPVLFAAIWFDEPWLSLLIGMVALLGALEFYRIVSQAGWQPLTLLGSLWAVLFILNAHSENPRTTPLLLASGAGISLVWLLFRPNGRRFLGNWLWTLGGAIYVGWMLSRFVPLRGLEEGRDWVFLVIFAIFAADTSAYFVGRALGRHPLVPAISPGKTWEGTMAGLLGGLGATFALTFILGLPLGWGQAAILGALIVIFALAGDLAESALKRRAGVKDSGWLIPGHGGVLDRIDSIVLSVVIVYYYVTWVIV